MDTVHPRSSLKKFRHYDKGESTHQNNFMAEGPAIYQRFEENYEPTPSDSRRENAINQQEIPTRFPVVDTARLDIDRLLHESRSSL